VLAALNRPDDALAQIREAVRRQPEHAALRNACGVTLTRAGRLREALTEFETAARLAPENAEFARNAALVAEQLRTR